MVRPLYPWALHILQASAITAVVLTTLGAASVIEPLVAPVITDWTVVASERVGSDLVLSGTMVKHRACTLVPPAIARDEIGQNRIVVSSALTAGLTWSADERPQKWGPWKIQNGAHHEHTVIISYRCHVLWPTVVEVGVFDDRRR